MGTFLDFSYFNSYLQTKETAVKLQGNEGKKFFQNQESLEVLQLNSKTSSLRSINFKNLIVYSLTPRNLIYR